MTLEQAIKNAIKGRGYTLDSAAKALNISRRTLYNYIGAANIDSEFAHNVNSILGIDIDKIISELDKTPTDKPSDTKLPKSHPQPKGSLLEYLLETGKEYAKRMIDIGKYPTAKDIAELEELAKKNRRKKKVGRLARPYKLSCFTILNSLIVQFAIGLLYAPDEAFKPL